MCALNKSQRHAPAGDTATRAIRARGRQISLTSPALPARFPTAHLPECMILPRFFASETFLICPNMIFFVGCVKHAFRWAGGAGVLRETRLQLLRARKIMVKRPAVRHVPEEGLVETVVCLQQESIHIRLASDGVDLT